MLLVMVVVDRVVTYHSYNTLGMVALLLGIAMLFEAYFGYIRRQLTMVVGRRVEARVNLEMFKRVLGLPIDFYERNQAGAIMYRLGHIGKVRDFLTGRVLATLLDVVTLLLLLPVLYILNPALTWLTLIAAVHHGAGDRVVHPPGPPRLPALRRRRDRQVHRAGRERARHPHGQVAGAGAAAQGGLGQHHRGRRQLEAGTARPGQLAADPGPPAGNRSCATA